jgi:acetylglutamate kinase
VTRRHAGHGSATTHVVKLGGRSLESAAEVRELAVEARLLGQRLVLVHGGGAEVSSWSRRLGIEPRFVDGLRVTDPETLEVVVAVLAGLANKRLTALLLNAGLNAVGISAVDGALVATGASSNPGLGAVGRVESVDTTLLETLLDAGFVPVVASIAAREGELLNVNADDVAAALAGALGAETLTLLSDVPGLKLEGSHVPFLTVAELPAVLSHPDVTGGMLPKLYAATHALRKGVGRVHIGAWGGAGTLAAFSEGRATATTIEGGFSVADERRAKGEAPHHV